MKDLIERKLKEYAHTLLVKPALTQEDIIFLVYMLNRYELKEAEDKSKEEREKHSEEWRNKMMNIIGGVI